MQILEQVARALLKTRGVCMVSNTFPDDALWLSYPKQQAIDEARACVQALIDADWPDDIELDDSEMEDFEIAAKSMLKQILNEPDRG